MKRQFTVSPNESKEVKAASWPDYPYDDEEYLTYEDNFFNTDMETDAINDAGLYIDWSSVRGDSGPMYICYDPNHECNSDMWDGSDEDILAVIDFSEYKDYIESEILSQPEEEWSQLFRQYLESFKE